MVPTHARIFIRGQRGMDVKLDMTRFRRFGSTSFGHNSRKTISFLMVGERATENLHDRVTRKLGAICLNVLSTIFRSIQLRHNDCGPGFRCVIADIELTVRIADAKNGDTRMAADTHNCSMLFCLPPYYYYILHHTYGHTRAAVRQRSRVVVFRDYFRFQLGA